MNERMVADVFQEAFEVFFTKNKATTEDGAPEGTAADPDGLIPEAPNENNRDVGAPKW